MAIKQVSEQFPLDPHERIIPGRLIYNTIFAVRFSSHIVVPVSMKSKVVRLELITPDPNRTTMLFDRGFHYCRPDWEEFLLGPVLLQHFHSIPDWQQRLFMLYVPSVVPPFFVIFSGASDSWLPFQGFNSS